MDAEKATNFREKLKKIEQEVFRQLKEETSCCGISLAQCHALLELEHLHETTISNLSNALQLDKSTLSRTINGLVQLGFVERTIDPYDRRFMRVNLSQKGKKFILEMIEKCNRYYWEMLQYIPQKKHKQVLESLELLIHSFYLMHQNSKQMSKDPITSKEKA